MIPAVPKIKRPQRPKKGGRGSKAKGRPITAEEFDRLIEKIPVALGDGGSGSGRRIGRRGGTRGRPSETRQPIRSPWK